MAGGAGFEVSASEAGATAPAAGVPSVVTAGRAAGADVQPGDTAFPRSDPSPRA